MGYTRSKRNNRERIREAHILRHHTDAERLHFGDRVFRDRVSKDSIPTISTSREMARETTEKREE